MTDLVASAAAAGTVIAAPATGYRVVIKAVHVSGSGAVSITDGTRSFAATAGSLNLSGIEVDMTPATAVTFAGTGACTIVYRLRKTGA